MKTLALILAVALLGGCATASQIKVPEVVKVPVPIPCKVEEPTAPDFRFSPPYDDIFAAVRDLLGDRELARAYENELSIAIKSCK